MDRFCENYGLSYRRAEVFRLALLGLPAKSPAGRKSFQPRVFRLLCVLRTDSRGSSGYLEMLTSASDQNGIFAIRLIHSSGLSSAQIKIIASTISRIGAF